MGIFDSLCDIVGDVIGTVGGIAVAPIAIALGVSEKVVIRALNAGCTTVDEVKDFIKNL